MSLWRGWKLPFSGTFCHLLLANSGILWWCYTHLLMLHTSSERLFRVKFLFWCQNLSQVIWVVFPRTGKMSKICHNFFSLELYCDQTVLFFQVFSIVLKRLCPFQSKNTFVLVLAFSFLFSKKLFFCPKSNFSAIFDALVTHFSQCISIVWPKRGIPWESWRLGDSENVVVFEFWRF